jgi:antitoxin PrlF
MKEADEVSDPVVQRFLAFLAQDESKLVDVAAALHNRIAALTNGVIVDLDAEIDGDVAI